MRSLFKNPFNSPMRSPTAEESYAFKLHLTPGTIPYDEATNVPASCSISGVRYGLVKGVVSSFVSNMPPVEDDGLRGCPAFTQLAKMTEDLANASWGKSRTTATLTGSFQGANIHRISETTDTGVHQVFDTTVFSGAVDNSVIGLCGVFKYAGRSIEIYARLKDGTYVVVGAVNLQTGQASNLRSGSVISVTALADAYYRILGTVSVVSGGTSPYIYFGLANNGVTSYTGDGVSGVFIGQPTYINFGVGGVPFIPPYIPNNTTSSVSVVSEAATATTGTSFDLDDSKLVKPKEGLRGKAIGANLWATPTFATPPWTDNGTHYVCDGTNTNSTFSCAGVLATGKLYELTFTTGSITSGTLWIYIGGIQVFNGTPTANTTYTLRTLTSTTGVNATFTNGNAFIGQIRKDIVVKEVQAQGHIKLEFESNVDSGWVTNGTNISIVAVNDNALNSTIYYRKLSGGGSTFYIYDSNTNNASVDIGTLIVDKVYRIAIDYGTYTDGTQKMRLTVNGVKSSVVAFSGSFGAQDLRFFFGNTVHVGWIKSLSYSEKPVW